jgi:hypothetical protein
LSSAVPCGYQTRPACHCFPNGAGPVPHFEHWRGRQRQLRILFDMRRARTSSESLPRIRCGVAAGSREENAVKLRRKKSFHSDSIGMELALPDRPERRRGNCDHFSARFEPERDPGWPNRGSFAVGAPFTVKNIEKRSREGTIWRCCLAVTVGNHRGAGTAAKQPN